MFTRMVWLSEPHDIEKTMKPSMQEKMPVGVLFNISNYIIKDFL